MKRIKAKTWEDLDVVPEGEWVCVPGGLDVEVVPPPSRPKTARVRVRIGAKDAASLVPGPGEVLEARLDGRVVEIVRRRAVRPKRSRA